MPHLSLRNRITTPHDGAFPDCLVTGGIVGEDAMGAAGGGIELNLRNPFAMLSNDSGVGGIGDKIGPLVRVVDHVVELFTTVRVDDVTPLLGAYPVISLVVTGHGGSLARGRGIGELRP